MTVSNAKMSPLMMESEPMARAHEMALSEAVPLARVDSAALNPFQAQTVLMPSPR